MPKITQLCWTWYPRPPPNHFSGWTRPPQAQDERCSEQVAAQRGLIAAKGHTAGRQSGGEGPVPGIVPHKDCQSGMGGRRPLIARQPEWPAPAAVPMERIAAHKRPDAFLGWRKGLCYLAQEAGVRAAGRWES